MPRFSSCQYGPRWLLEPVITSVFQHQEGENWRRKTCHFLLRTFPRNCISIPMGRTRVKWLGLATGRLRNVNLILGGARGSTCFAMDYILVLPNEWIVRYDGVSIPVGPPISLTYKSLVWAKVAWPLPLLSTYITFLPLRLQTCCFLCLKCFQVVFSFNVELKLNSYFFVKLISLAYKCTALLLNVGS